MDLKTNPPAFTKIKTVVIPSIPQDIVDQILDHLVIDSDSRALRACALVSKSWVESCQRHLFYTALFTFGSVREWARDIPVPEESPARHVRDLRICVGGKDWVPEKFFEYTSWFTNVRRLTLLGRGGFPPFRTPSLWRLPRSVASLIITTNVCTLVEIRIMARLPNLDDLSLLGSPIRVDEDILLEVGTTLRGRFGGKLVPHPALDAKDFMSMLLEIPTRLHFTEVEICCARECLPLVVRLTDACDETLANYPVPNAQKMSARIRRFRTSHVPPTHRAGNLTSPAGISCPAPN